MKFSKTETLEALNEPLHNFWDVFAFDFSKTGLRRYSDAQSKLFCTSVQSQIRTPRVYDPPKSEGPDFASGVWLAPVGCFRVKKMPFTLKGIFLDNFVS